MELFGTSHRTGVLFDVPLTDMHVVRHDEILDTYGDCVVLLSSFLDARAGNCFWFTCRNILFSNVRPWLGTDVYFKGPRLEI